MRRRAHRRIGKIPGRSALRSSELGAGRGARSQSAIEDLDHLDRGIPMPAGKTAGKIHDRHVLLFTRRKTGVL